MGTLVYIFPPFVQFYSDSNRKSLRGTDDYVFKKSYARIGIYKFSFSIGFLICGMLYQGPSQISDQDEAIFERRRREPLGGSGGMTPTPPQEILKSRGSEMLL